MSVLDLIPASWRPWLVGAVLAAMALFFFKIGGFYEAGRYVQELAQLKTQQAKAEQQRMASVLADLRGAQQKSRALADRIQANDEIHQKELTGVQSNQKILTSRLATSELRLSVLLASTAQSAGDQHLSASASAGGVVHAASRGELDPAAAQRIVAITGDGDEGLTALSACQGYVNELIKADQLQADAADTQEPGGGNAKK